MAATDPASKEREAGKRMEAASAAGISPEVDYTIKAERANVKDKGVFITGGASGIGAAIAKALAENGAYVTVGDLSVDNGKAFEESCTKEGLHVKFVPCDVAHYRSQLAAFKEAVSFPPSHTLSHVFANAGVPGHFMKIPHEDKFDPDAEPEEPRLGSIQIGLVGAYYTTYLATHYLRKTPGDRSVIITCSMSAYTPMPYRGDYCAAKAGVRSLMKTMRSSKKDMGLRVNMLVPNFVMTPMTAPNAEAIKKRGYHFSSMDEVTEAACRLTCDDTIHSRAVSIDKRGIADMKDDHEGLDKEVIKFRWAAG